MAEPLATAFVRIRPQTDTFEKETRTGVTKAGRGLLRDADRHGRLFGTTYARATMGPFRSIIGFVRGPLLAGFAAITGARIFGGLIDEAREAGRVGRITAQVIKSTGGVANVTAGQVAKLAERLSNATAIDDELIQSSSNLLLTFKNVRNELGRGNAIFDRATAASLDLSAAGFGSVDSAAKMLGKALNDPLKGLTALGRAGVTFTQQQKDQIAALVEAGDVLGAQRIILQEVESQVGGAAKAAADPMARLGVVVNNLKERLGTALLPIVESVANFLANRLMPALEDVGDFIRDTVVPAVKGMADAFKTGESDREGWLGFLDQLAIVARKVFDFLKNEAAPALASLAGFIARNSDYFGPFLVLLATGLGLLKLITIATAAWNAVLLLNPIGLIVVAIAALAAGLIYAYQHSETFRKIVDTTFRIVWGTIQAVFNWVKANWPLLLGLLTGPIGLAVVLIMRYWGTIKAAFLNGVNAVVRFLRELPGRAVSALAALGTMLLNLAVNAMRFWLRGYLSGWGAVYRWLRGLPRIIIGALGDLGSLLFNAGKAIIQGLVNGMKSLASKPIEIAKDIAGGIADLFPGSPVKEGPLRSFNQGHTGEELVRMLASGIQAGQRQLAPVALSTAGISAPSAAAAAAGGGAATYKITVMVPPNVNMHEVGRVTVEAIKAYESGSGAGWRR